jgi:hypothetical protein
MQPTLFVKRQGRHMTVYLDTTTNLPMPLAGFDDEPIGGFPMTVEAPEVAAYQKQGYTVAYVDPPKKAQPELRLTADQEARAAKEHGELEKAAPSAPPKPQPTREAAPQPQAAELVGALLHEFESRVRLQFLSQDESQKTEIEVIGDYLIATNPEFENVLLEIVSRVRTAQPKRRFRL